MPKYLLNGNSLNSNQNHTNPPREIFLSPNLDFGSESLLFIKLVIGKAQILGQSDFSIKIPMGCLGSDSKLGCQLRIMDQTLDYNLE